MEKGEAVSGYFVNGAKEKSMERGD